MVSSSLVVIDEDRTEDGPVTEAGGADTEGMTSWIWLVLPCETLASARNLSCRDLTSLPCRGKGGAVGPTVTLALIFDIIATVYWCE